MYGLAEGLVEPKVVSKKSGTGGIFIVFKRQVPMTFTFILIFWKLLLVVGQQVNR